jgi:hypothetical protein
MWKELLMSKFFNDETRALIVAFFPDLLSLAVAFGVDITDDQQRLAMSALTKAIVLIFYLFKTGQNQGPDGNSLATQKKDERA